MPPIAVAAAAIQAVACLPAFRDLPEPFRAAACALGWSAADGSPWWDAVMDAIG